MCLRVTVLLTVCCIRHFNASTTSLWNRLEILTPKFLRLFFLLRILTSFSVEYSHLIISRYSNMPNVHLKGLLVPFIEGIYPIPFMYRNHWYLGHPFHCSQDCWQKITAQLKVMLAQKPDDIPRCHSFPRWVGWMS